MALWYLFLLVAKLANASKYIMYLTGQHYVIPEPSLVSAITHVELAFMQSSIFNELQPSDFPLFTDVETVRSQFTPGTTIMVAIGGWGDTEGFSKAAATESSRKLFAKNVKAMVDFTGADGKYKSVDIDWEYPGGNGEDYKQVPNAEKSWEIDTYPKLLAEIRSALGPQKLISAAVPGLRRDMLAFTKDTIPKIDASLDFWNIMTYDLMNRRDNITKHHTGIDISLDSINAYLKAGVPSQKANLGFAFYVKWFKTDPEGGCKRNPIGCNAELMEDPITGRDLGKAGQFAWCDDVPSMLGKSFQKAMKGALWDDVEGGNYYFDTEENIFWSWDAPYVIDKKIHAIVEEENLGGVFAWGLGEDGDSWDRLTALTAAYLQHSQKSDYQIKDEL